MRFPGKRMKCKCGGKVFRVQRLGPGEHELFCQRCHESVMVVKETPEEFKKTQEGLSER